MRLAVPKETAPGERRVALVPETVSRLSARRFRGQRRPRRGRRRGLSGRRLRGGRCAGARCCRGPLERRSGRLRLEARSGRNRGAFPRDRPRRLPPAAHGHGGNRTAARGRRRRLRDGVDSADHARAVDGRALLAGDRGGLQGRPPRGRPRTEALPDAHDGRGDDRACSRARDRRGRRGPPGDRNRTAARCRGLGVRRPAGGEGAGREPRRVVPRPRRPHRGDGGRLRAGALGGASRRSSKPRSRSGSPTSTS